MKFRSLEVVKEKLQIEKDASLNVFKIPQSQLRSYTLCRCTKFIIKFIIYDQILIRGWKKRKLITYWTAEILWKLKITKYK